MLANLAGFDPAQDMLPDEQLLPLDRWALDARRGCRRTCAGPTTATSFTRSARACTTSAPTKWAASISISSRTVSTRHARQRAAPLGADRAVPHCRCAWRAGWRRSSASPPMKSGKTFPGSARTRCCWRPGAGPARLPAEQPPGCGLLGRDRRRARRGQPPARGPARRGCPAWLPGCGGHAVLRRRTAGAPRALGDELRFVLITSAAAVEPLAAAPETAARNGGRRPACRGTGLDGGKMRALLAPARRRGQRPAHPTLCARCVSNVEGPGEERRFA
jgi:isoleucyl-tRNA synthetase